MKSPHSKMKQQETTPTVYFLNRRFYLPDNRGRFFPFNKEIVKIRLLLDGNARTRVEADRILDEVKQQEVDLPAPPHLPKLENLLEVWKHDWRPPSIKQRVKLLLKVWRPKNRQDGVTFAPPLPNHLQEQETLLETWSRIDNPPSLKEQVGELLKLWEQQNLNNPCYPNPYSVLSGEW
jgi:hypothetical protein